MEDYCTQDYRITVISVLQDPYRTRHLDELVITPRVHHVAFYTREGVQEYYVVRLPPGQEYRSTRLSEPVV